MTIERVLSPPDSSHLSRLRLFPRGLAPSSSAGHEVP